MSSNQLQSITYSPHLFDPSTVGLFDSRRLYRFRTDARFSFPFGNATSPAAVPVRPFLHEIAISTSFTMSNKLAAVVHFPLLCFAVGGKLVADFGGDNLRCWYEVGS